MSREIKFRAWLTEDNRMVPWERLWLELEDGYGGVFEQGERKEDMTSDFELMQYTGLKDKNGVEIYESDVIRFKDLTYKDAPERIGVVQFRNGSFCISTEFTTNYAWLNYEREVIGNIYENVDLLENTVSK